jgi:zinc protease
MGFRGIEGFPGTTMLDYLQDHGLRFGGNINAFVGFNEMRFFLTGVPSTTEGLVDTCLRILRGWAGGILMEEEYVEIERGVIREEWRTRESATMRMFENLLPGMFPGTRYAHRMPIGCINVINYSTIDDLVEFYKTWFRPDLQAVVVVGDVDVDAMEQRIIELFSDLTLDPNRPEHVHYPVPDNYEPLIAIATDPEATNTQIMLFFKHDLMPLEMRNTQNAFIWNYMMRAATQMMNQRFSEIVQRPNAPFAFASASDGDFFVAQTKNAWSVSSAADENYIDVALAAMMRETERARRFGFTHAEYEIARTNILQSHENAFNNRGTMNTSVFTQQLTSKFINNTSAPGVEYQYNLIQQIAPNIPVEMINQAFQAIFKEGGKNVVVALMGPEREGLIFPTEAELLTVLESVWAEEIEPHVQETIDEPLISVSPTPGQIVNEERNEAFDATIWTLQNGMRIVLKSTDFRDDQILMTASSWGGFSPFAMDEPLNSRMISSVMTLGGLGNFSAIELPRVLAGKTASANPTISLNQQGFSGSSSIRDFETMLQLVHLHFTAPRKDEDAFTSLIQRMDMVLRNQEAEPRVAFGDAISYALRGDNPIVARMTADDLAMLDYARMMQMFRQIFSNPGSFTFTFVGNLDKEAIRPVIEKYLASLPGQAVQGEFVSVPMDFRTGERENIFRREMQTPIANTFIARTGTIEFNQRNNILMNLFSRILTMVYLEIVREEEGGTYHISASGSISRYPSGQASLQILYDTDPDLVEHLNNIVLRELYAIIENGTPEAEFNRVIEQMNVAHAARLRENGYWLTVLNTKYFHGEDNHTYFLDIVNSITREEVQEFARVFLEQGNTVKVVMLPTEEE